MKRKHQLNTPYSPQQDIYTFPEISFEGLSESTSSTPQIIDVPYVSSILGSLKLENPVREECRRVHSRKILSPSKKVIRRPTRYFFKSPPPPIPLPEKKPEQVSKDPTRENNGAEGQLDHNGLKDQPPIERFEQLQIRQPENRSIWVHNQYAKDERHEVPENRPIHPFPNQNPRIQPPEGAAGGPSVQFEEPPVNPVVIVHHDYLPPPPIFYYDPYSGFPIAYPPPPIWHPFPQIDQRQVDAAMDFFQQHAPILFQHPIFHGGMQVAPSAAQPLINTQNQGQSHLQDSYEFFPSERPVQPEPINIPPPEFKNLSTVQPQDAPNAPLKDLRQYQPQIRLPSALGHNSQRVRPQEQNVPVPRQPVPQLEPHFGERNVTWKMNQDPEGLNVIWKLWNQGGQDKGRELIQKNNQAGGHASQQKEQNKQIFQQKGPKLEPKPHPEEKIIGRQFWSKEELLKNQALLEQRPDENRHQLWHFAGRHVQDIQQTANQSINPAEFSFQNAPNLLPPQNIPNIIRPWSNVERPEHPEERDVHELLDAPDRPIRSNLLPEDRKIDYSDSFRRRLYRPCGPRSRLGSQASNELYTVRDQPDILQHPDGLEDYPLVSQPELMNIHIPPLHLQLPNVVPEPPHPEFRPLPEPSVRQNDAIGPQFNVSLFNPEKLFEQEEIFKQRRGLSHKESYVNSPVVLAEEPNRRQFQHPGRQDINRPVLAAPAHSSEIQNPFDAQNLPPIQIPQHLKVPKSVEGQGAAANQEVVHHGSPRGVDPPQLRPVDDAQRGYEERLLAIANIPQEDHMERLRDIGGFRAQQFYLLGLQSLLAQHGIQRCNVAESSDCQPLNSDPPGPIRLSKFSRPGGFGQLFPPIREPLRQRPSPYDFPMLNYNQPLTAPIVIDGAAQMTSQAIARIEEYQASALNRPDDRAWPPDRDIEKNRPQNGAPAQVQIAESEAAELGPPLSYASAVKASNKSKQTEKQSRSSKKKKEQKSTIKKAKKQKDETKNDIQQNDESLTKDYERKKGESENSTWQQQIPTKKCGKAKEVKKAEDQKDKSEENLTDDTNKTKKSLKKNDKSEDYVNTNLDTEENLTEHTNKSKKKKKKKKHSESKNQDGDGDAK